MANLWEAKEDRETTQHSSIEQTKEVGNLKEAVTQAWKRQNGEIHLLYKESKGLPKGWKRQC